MAAFHNYPLGAEKRNSTSWYDDNSTCRMCACRCGVDVRLTSGHVSDIESNRGYTVNKGALCAKDATDICR